MFWDTKRCVSFGWLFAQERVECYPKVRLVTITILENKCEACQLQRQCSFNVKLSGQLYDNNTLQEDHFMPNDTQVLHTRPTVSYKTLNTKYTNNINIA